MELRTPHLHFRRQSLRDHGIARAPEEPTMEHAPTDHPNAITATGYTSQAVGHIDDLEIVRASNGALYSAWRPTWEERARLFFGARIWLAVCGERQPPVSVTASFWPWEATPTRPQTPMWRIRALGSIIAFGTAGSALWTAYSIIRWATG